MSRMLPFTILIMLTLIGCNGAPAGLFGPVDTDGDGLLDSDEVSIGTNPQSSDTDGDGIDDRTEITTTLTDPLNPDTDGDRLTDSAEAGFFKTSPLKLDTDDDGLDDGAEVYDALTDPLAPDSDDDGLDDGDEWLAHFTNPLSNDTDSDGLSDFDEILVHFTSALLPDSDFDGLSDGFEVAVTGSDPKDLDTDGDLLFDDDEYVLGLDLLTANPTGFIGGLICPGLIVASGSDQHPLGGVYSYGGFPSGFLLGNFVAFSPEGAIVANVTTGETGFGFWQGNIGSHSFIVDAAPTPLSVAVLLGNGLEYEISFLDLDEIGDWFIGDDVYVYYTPPDPVYQIDLYHMVNLDLCESVLVNP